MLFGKPAIHFLLEHLPQGLHSSFDLNRLKKTKQNLIDIPDHNAMDGGRLYPKIKKILIFAITLLRKYL